ncbi:PRC-barrel domain-containing protein [Candidatus Woesearchaeota archaeon]|nr:PRC-barrel domain-containing protein [Candidatus Woesearchaeota archaeon]
MTKQEPILLSKRLSTMDNTTTVKDYFGKKVYSTSGDYVGRVYDVVLYEGAYVGLLVQGRRKLFIDKDYCEPETVDNIILKVDPVTMLRGKVVFDSEGKRLGRVVGFERTGVRNTCDTILVRKSLFKKPVEVPYADIETSKKNIILNKAY